MKPDKTYITRKIYFYKIYSGKNGSGKPEQYDIKCVLETIEKLDFNTPARYLKDEDGFDICCWIDSLITPQKVRFGKIKRDDLPQIEHRGNLTPLSIPKESGLAECVHVMFFPENIVGVEYSYDGPKVPRINDYLYVKSKDVCPQIPVFEQLLQPDVIKKLDQMQIVRRFRLKVRESLFSSTEQADEYLGKAFQAARELGDAKEIELILSVGRGRGTLGTKVRDMTKRLLMLKDTSTDLISGEIKGIDETGRTEIIDLLNAKLVAEKHILRNAASNSELYYSAIEAAYQDLKDQLLKASGVTL